MKTVWILARSLHSAMEALHKNLEASAFQEDFISFRFIATAEQVRNLPRGETFLVVKKWHSRPDAEEVLQAIKEQEWQTVSLKDLFLDKEAALLLRKSPQL
ncbi:MAG: hypothetical protein V3R64_06140 [Sphingomonadales bacterium]